MASEVRPKKQVSERRRQQNKQSQKNYRERQKRNLQVLQDLTGSRCGFLLDQSANIGADLLSSRGNPKGIVSDFDAIGGASVTDYDLPTSLDLNRRELPQNNIFGENQHHQAFSHAKPPASPGSSSSVTHEYSIPQRLNVKEVHDCNISTLRQNSISVGLSSQRLLEEGNRKQLLGPEEVSPEDELKFCLVRKDFTVGEILKAGLKALSHDLPADITASGYQEGQGQRTKNPRLRTDKILVLQNVDQEALLPLPDIYKNNLRIKQILFTAACVANASVLGLGFEAATCDYEISPFFRDSISEDAARKTCQNSFKDLKEYLRPCIRQLMHSHHPYIDVLPFPTFRERVIKLAYTDEPMIDEDDLCNDLQNDGLICWGSSLGGGSAATGSGAPWDIRSWEAQPWFLKKWWILIGGAEGEIYKQTQWWCEMRGDRFCYPW